MPESPSTRSSTARREAPADGADRGPPALQGDDQARAILQSITDFAIVATDRDGRITDWNVGAERVLGGREDEMRGADIACIFTDEDVRQQRHRQEMALALRDGRADDERWHVRRDARRFWASGQMVPLRSPAGEHLGFVKVLCDSSEQQRAGLQHAALLVLSDRLRQLSHPAHIEAVGCEILAQALGADRVGYGRVDDVEETVTIERDWFATGLGSLAGKLHYRDYGSYIDDLRQGQVAVVHDVRADPRTSDRASVLAQLGACAFVNLPLTERDRFVAMLFVAQREPRAWHASEVAFIREVAERVRSSTERVRSESALRASEAQFRILAQGMPNLVWTVRADGRVDWMNDAVAQYTGAALRELAAPGAWERLVHPDDLPIARAWSATLAQEREAGSEFRLQQVDGRYRWFQVRVRPVFGNGGRVTRWLGTATDIDERRRHAARLERLVGERTADRNALWQLSNDLMARATHDGLITAANPAWTYVLGWPVEQVVDASLYDLVHPDDQVRTRAAIEGLSQGHTLQGFDNRYRHRDGSYRWISWSARPGGGLINAVGRDVTADREQAQALRDSMDFARLALSAVGGVGVWQHDIPSDRVNCDAALAALYGLDPEEAQRGLSRERFLANVHPDDLPRLATTLADGLQRPGELEVEFRILHPDGRMRWVLARGHTAFDEVGRPARRTGIGVDITRQRSLEEQLQQSQKLEAVGQLTGGIAHDFNNMLSTINTSIELLKRRLAEAPTSELERYLAVAHKGVRGAASLTQRLLAFSRKQTLDIRTVDVNRLVHGLEDLLRGTLGERIALSLALQHRPWGARTDANQLDNALVNLAINARDAMPDGGRLTIRTENCRMQGRDAAACELSPGDYLALHVSDTGMGMPPDVMRRAFDPFFTTKAIGKGTGLGLSMIYGYAKQSGGGVRLQSAVGAGTTVTLYLPRADAGTDADAEGAEVDEAAPARPVAAGHGERILVVEDEPDVRAMLVEVLQSCGYATCQAGDAPAALELLGQEAPFDLLLTDVGLPGASGRELATRAQSERPGLKVLFLTGYAREAAVRGEFLGEGMDMMAKPFQIDELTARVQAMVRR